ncbi:MAG: insulinase family protein, partial [Gammaproteobacteria bacterium]|nr:insulinase family protein [Gammaproteobacteria bacterium]
VAKIQLLDKRSDSAIIDINLLFNTGVAVDPEGKKGLSALLTAMLTQGGSDVHSYNELKQLSYPLAASFYGQVDKEMFSLRSRVHRDNLASWYPLLMEQLLTPGWRSDDLERLRTDLINSIESGLKASNDEELGKEVLYSKLYQGHAYQSLNLGDISDLKSITLEDLQAFYAEQLTQGNLTLGVAGDMSDQMLKQLTIDLGQLALGDNKRLTIAKAPSLTGHHVTIVDKPGLKSTAVSFGFPLNLTRSDDDWVAMWLVRSWLGQHRSHNSFLYQRIRQIRGMNYGDYSYIEYFPRGMYRTQPNSNLGRSEQIFQVWLRPLRDNKDAHFATRVAMFELDKLIENGLSPEQFDATRNFLKNYVPQLVASQDRQLGYALDSEFYGTGDFVDMVRNKLATLDVKQVNAAIKRHLSTKDIQYVFVSGDAKDMAQRLSTEQISPMSYNAEKPLALTDQDKQISQYRLNIDSVETIALDKVFK